MYISNKKFKNVVNPPLKFGSTILKEVEQHKHSGIWLTKDLTWKKQIDAILLKADKRINIMTGLKYILDRRTLETMHNSFVRPIFDYADVV